MTATSQRHIISKMVLDVNTSDARDAHGLQEELSSLLKHNIGPALEQTFDQLVKNGHHLRIEKLTLQLPAIQKKELAHQLPELLRAALHNELLRLLSEQARQTPLTNKAKGNLQDGVLLFLATGQWPWWSAPLPSRVWLKDLKTDMQQADSAQRLASLAKLLQSNSDAMARLIYQAGNPFLLHLLEYWGSSISRQSMQYLLRAIAVLPTKLNRRNIRNELFINALGRVVLQKKPNSLSLLDIIKEALTKKDSGHSINDPLRLLTAQLPKIRRKDGPAAAWLKDQLHAWQISKPPKFDNKPSSLPDNRTSGQTATQQPLLIDHAGLAILHPFLEHLFKNNGWLEEKTFKNQSSRHRAVLLLHYLATGQTKAAPHQLPFNKLLCGMPIHSPVDTGIRLKKAWLKQADQLLQSVIRHWSMLKNTSPAGLRSTFIQRPGKLEQKENGDWKLIVQRKTEDILLPHIPWNIGIIKMPWMPKILWVEW